MAYTKKERAERAEKQRAYRAHVKLVNARWFSRWRKANAAKLGKLSTTKP